jgi:hypothetical protein
MTILAGIRPDDWNLPLFLHVGGAMILVAGIVSAVAMLGVAGTDGRLLRLGHRSLLYAGLPGYIVMRGAAQWIADKEGYEDKGAPSPTWLDIGFIVSDIGALLLLIALITGWIGVARMRDGRGGERLVRVTMLISIVLLVGYTVAAWAMSAKPS